MMTFEEALKTTLDQWVSFGTEMICFEEAPGRVLAQPVVCDTDIPAFDKSAMDGYACRRSDLGHPLKVIEVIRAGLPPVKAVGAGECAQIMTGAEIPEGADTVIKVEDVENEEGVGDPGSYVRFVGSDSANHIMYRGEDLKAGETVIAAGTRLDVRHVPILATAGSVSVSVARVPSVGVLSTGTELVEPGDSPGPSQIRNTNAYQMIAQLKSLAIDADYYGIATDEFDTTRNRIGQAMSQNDIVILSGGVSMGEFDFVPDVMKSLGINIFYDKVAIQPGKPTLFGRKQNRFIFGLPGNPVSSYFTMELLVKPFIYRCMGSAGSLPVLRLPAGREIIRHKTQRMSWIPVSISQEGQVFPVEYHGSAHILALRDADGIVSVPIGKTAVRAGEILEVRLLRSV